MSEKLERVLIQISLKEAKSKQMVAERLSALRLFYENKSQSPEEQILESKIEIDELSSAADADLQVTLREILEEDIQALILPFIRGMAEVQTADLISKKQPAKSASAEKEFSNEKIRVATLSLDVETDKMESVLERIRVIMSDMESHLENYHGITELLFDTKVQQESERARPVKSGQTRVYISLFGEFPKKAVDRLQSAEFRAEDFPQITDRHLAIVTLFPKTKSELELSHDQVKLS